MFYTSAFLRKVKDKDGSHWVGVLSYKDVDSSWKQKSKSFKKCKYKRDAQQALNKWWEDEESKISIKDREQTLDVAMEDCLKKQKHLGIISNRSYNDDLRIVRKTLDPLCGKWVVKDIDSEQLQELVNTMSAKYKPSTVRDYYAIVTKSIKNKVTDDDLYKKMTKDVTLPKDEVRRINYLDKDGRKKFLASMVNENSQFYYPSMIAYYSGMRAGEICGLRWRDINFALNIITVDYAAKDYDEYETGETIEEMGDTKTHKRRVIPLMPQLKAILLARMEEVNPKPDDLVCNHRRPRLLCTSFQKWAKRHQIIGTLGKPITMHGLRHTFATVSIKSGMDVKSLQSILGHASAAMTLNVYASDDDDAKMLAMAKLSNFFDNEEEEDL